SRRLPNWILMKVNEFVDLVLLDQTFPGGRPRLQQTHPMGHAVHPSPTRRLNISSDWSNRFEPIWGRPIPLRNRLWGLFPWVGWTLTIFPPNSSVRSLKWFLQFRKSCWEARIFVAPQP